MPTIALTRPQSDCLNAWLGEIVWICPDDLLPEMRALDGYIAGRALIPLSNTQCALLIGFAEFVLETRNPQPADKRHLNAIFDKINRLAPAFG